VAALAIYAIRRARLNRKILTRLSYAIMLGIFAQAILGGITVLTQLHPLTVAAHFMLSIVLITVAYNLYWRARESGDTHFKLTVPAVFRLGVKLHITLAFTVIVIGSLVTGSGPHAGDSGDITRLPLDPRIISWLHADTVLLFNGLTIGLLVGGKALNLPTQVNSAVVNVLVVSLAQGLIGYVQYFTGLPWVLVALHIAGACVLWVVSLRLLLSTRVIS
jgi:cytochrome c oxidase assembly protein subunit 15